MSVVDQVLPEAVLGWSRERYDALIQSGFLDDERIELLYGRLVRMSPQGAAHNYVVRVLTRLLTARLPSELDLQVQGPFAASGVSEPEPDLILVPRAPFDGDHPTEAVLAVEVADTSIRKDREVKGPLYAETGIPEYWIVNIGDRLVEVYSTPEGGRYLKADVRRPGETLTTEAIPGLEVPVRDILP